MDTSSKATSDVTSIDEGYRKTEEKLEEMLGTLNEGYKWVVISPRCFQYKGFWLPEIYIKGSMMIDDHFKPRPSDIIVASNPKCGTTWLKALTFAIVNRNSYFDFQNHPLLTSNPHDFVPFLELFILQEAGSIESLPSPRLLSAHLAFSSFPTSMRCRFVYICRDPKDALVSMWYYVNKLRPEHLPPLSLEVTFDLFSKGLSLFGPFWDHVLGYWKASLESPNKVLFLKYEDMKREPSVYVRKLAEFLDLPFSAEEEDEGIVDKIVKLCSFENLSNLDVNKNNVKEKKRGFPAPLRNSDFFRKGLVGDWFNHLTPEMVKVLDQITEEKFRGTGLNFN
ncbi:hypothetical protein COLO4_11701 [Corchorus olitorius]|uniref:Sulfotransferase n=1 Tax=Corchorus olitorius TaxID=93759 RepID=A0A1R3K3V3_9ROSI|nr:hypothetical protein COLO4_11701 [Corchorus olitorius]